MSGAVGDDAPCVCAEFLGLAIGTGQAGDGNVHNNGDVHNNSLESRLD